MTTQPHANLSRRYGFRRFLLTSFAIAAVACGDAGDDAAAGDARTETADSVAQPPPQPTVNRPAPRPPGDTVAITATLDEYSVTVSPDTIDSGSISLLLQNDGERSHIIEIRGENGSRWVSLPIRPGGGLTMTMRIETGTYTVSSTDTAYIERGMRGTFRVR
jgi:hypothetical protein